MRRFNLATVLIIPLMLLSACEDQEVAKETVVRPVRSTVVGDAAILQERTFSGRAKASVELDLAFNVSGPLISRPVIVGQEIKAGTLVAQIDPDRFKAELDQASAQLARSIATATNTDLSLERDKILFKKGHIAKAKLDRTKAKADESNADIKASKANRDRAQIELDYTRLKAPIDGIVVQTYVENFENVQAKQSIMRIVDNSLIEMVIDIPEDLISLAPQAKDILVVFDTFKDIKIPAKISKIGTEATANTRTYPVTLVMSQPANVNILPGMAGTASASGGEITDQSVNIEIPVTAMATFPGEQGSFVWLIDKDSMTVKRTKVEVGDLTDHGITITNGLSKGDRVVVAGVNYLKEGQKVALAKEQVTK
ncbi:MAG: efflux RND transporter periplasmic adaptor subunit [Sneathiella sp.]